MSLGSFTGQIGTPFDRAATLAHEFGHNLGLVHGAANAFQPNKPSIMSYFYQLAGVHTAILSAGLSSAQAALFKEMDYSEGTMCSLNESALNEKFGSGMIPVDWNCDGAIAGSVSLNIDSASAWCGSTNTGRAILPDVNEWALIHDPTIATPNPAPIEAPKEVSCVTADQMKVLRQFAPLGRQPGVASEPCITARMIYAAPGSTAGGSGLCSDPYQTVGGAQGGATDGSHIFLVPGTHTGDAGPLVLYKPMVIFCNIGGASVHPH